MGEENSLKLQQGKSPIHLAAIKGDLEKVELLIQAGIDVDITDESGNTFIHLAAREGKAGILYRYLHEIDVNSVNDDNETALHMAVRNGHMHAVILLIQKADLKIMNSSQESSMLRVRALMQV